MCSNGSVVSRRLLAVPAVLDDPLRSSRRAHAVVYFVDPLETVDDKILTLKEKRISSSSSSPPLIEKI